MALEDLDLEFEDEEEQKKKRNEAVHVDVDLEFGASPEKPQAAPVQAAPSADSSAPKPAPSGAGAQVKKIEEVRAKMAQTRAAATNPVAAQTVTAVSSPGAAGKPVVAGATALQLAPAMPEGENLAQLYQLVEDTKFEARVQVAVAQEKGEFMAEVLSDAKLLQHQVQQLLLRMNTKHPDLKPELMAIQKALADFLAKKRK